MKRPLVLGCALAALLACSQTRDTPLAPASTAQQAAPSAALTEPVVTRVIERHVYLPPPPVEPVDETQDDQKQEQDAVTAFTADCENLVTRDDAVVCALRALKPQTDWVGRLMTLLGVVATFLSGVLSAQVAQALAEKRAEKDRLRGAIGAVDSIRIRAFHVWGDLEVHRLNLNGTPPTTNPEWLAHVQALKQMFESLVAPGALALPAGVETNGMLPQLNAAQYMAGAGLRIMKDLEAELLASPDIPTNIDKAINRALNLAGTDFAHLQTTATGVLDRLKPRLAALEKRWF